VHKGLAGRTSAYLDFLRIVHKPPLVLHKLRPELHRNRARVLRSGPDQIAPLVAEVASASPGFDTRRELALRAIGNVRRALIGMSDKGPSLDDHGTGVPPRR
jgi:hypothetical protein